MIPAEVDHWIDYWIEEDFWSGLWEPLFEIAGQSVLALFLGGMVLMALYSWTESYIPPAVVAALFGGILIIALPPVAARIVTIAVALAVATVLYAVWRGR